MINRIPFKLYFDMKFIRLDQKTRNGQALAIPTCFLVAPDKLHIKRPEHDIPDLLAKLSRHKLWLTILVKKLKDWGFFMMRLMLDNYFVYAHVAINSNF